MLTTHTAGRIPPSLFRNICIGTVLNSQVQGHCVSGAVNLDQLLQILEGKIIPSGSDDVCEFTSPGPLRIGSRDLTHIVIIFSSQTSERKLHFNFPPPLKMQK
jgi:hypothetical protein